MPRRQVLCLLSFLCQKPSVFNEARRPVGDVNRSHMLSKGHFSGAGEEWMAWCWWIMTEYHRKFQAMVSEEILLAELSREMAALGVPDSSAAYYFQEVKNVFNADLSSSSDDYGIQTLKKFLVERQISDQMNHVIRSTAGDVPENISNILVSLNTDLQRIDGLSSGDCSEILSDDLFRADSVRISATGIKFIDTPMHGGRAEDEVVIIYGATGSGKTRLTTMLAASIAEKEHQLSSISGKPTRPIFFFTYETEPGDIKRRILSSASRVTKDRLLQFPWSEHLTSRERNSTLLPYELKRNIQANRDPSNYSGEIDRIREVLPYLTCVKIFDHRGAKNDPVSGSGFVSEIESKIARKVNEMGLNPSVVFIDYMDLVCRRYIDAKSSVRDREKEIRDLLSRFGGEIRRNIAEKYNCTVFITKQLSGEANSRKPTMRQSYADSADCKTTANEVDFTFQFGTPDKKNGSVVMWHGKTRRGPAMERDYSILTYESDYEWFTETRQIIHQGVIKDEEELKGFRGDNATPVIRSARIAQPEY